MTSFSWSPALAAGLSGITLVTSTPGNPLKLQLRNERLGHRARNNSQSGRFGRGEICVDAADENNDGQNERKIMEMRILQQNRPLHG